MTHLIRPIHPERVTEALMSNSSLEEHKKEIFLKILFTMIQSCPVGLILNSNYESHK